MSKIERHSAEKKVPGLPETNLERSEMVRNFPLLNNHPKIKYNDESGKLYIFHYSPMTGQTGEQAVAQREWGEFHDVESALRAKPTIMDKYDKEEDPEARFDSVVGMVSSLSRQFMEHVSKEDLVEVEKLAAGVFVKAKFADADKDQKRRIIEQVLAVTEKNNLEQVDAATRPPSTVLGRLGMEIVYERIVEQMTNKTTKGVIETLLLERAIERCMLEQAADYAQSVSKLRPGIGSPLRNSLPGIKDFFRRNMSYETIRLKNYSDVAVEARFLVIGRTDNEIDRVILKQYLGEEAANRILDQDPREIGHVTVDQASKRLEYITKKIRAVLRDGDINLLLEDQRPTPQ